MKTNRKESDMTNEEKELLLKDLCARLPYRVMVHEDFTYFDGYKIVSNTQDTVLDTTVLDWLMAGAEEVKPYLRPMSSMTEEEKETYQMFFNEDDLLNTSIDTYLDWLLEGHFDFRGLIPKGLAIEAPEGMYNLKEK